MCACCFLTSKFWGLTCGYAQSIGIGVNISLDFGLCSALQDATQKYRKPWSSAKFWSSQCHQNINNKNQCCLIIHLGSKLLTSLANWEVFWVLFFLVSWYHDPQLHLESISAFSTEQFNCCKRLLAFIWQPFWGVKLEPLSKFKYRGTYMLFSLSPKALIMAVDRTGLLLRELWICRSLPGELSFSLEIKSKAFSAYFWKGLSLMSSSWVFFQILIKGYFSLLFPYFCITEMASDIPGSVALPVAPMSSGQVRMAGSMPSRGGKRRSG